MQEENPFREMAREGVPRTDEPTDVAAPKKEEQDLPKLSPQEFRIYNRMAEHMDMFVSLVAKTFYSKTRKGKAELTGLFRYSMRTFGNHGIC